MEEKVCCFIGHRRIAEKEQLREKLYQMIEKLILYKHVTTFLFGSKSEFDSLCLTVVTKLKEKYPQIQRIYIRAEFPYITDDYQAYLLQSYDDTYYPNRILNAGRAVYVERNFIMIDQSDFCVIYYHETNQPTEGKHKSGTKIAYEYAQKKEKIIIQTANDENRQNAQNNSIEARFFV